MSIQPQELHPIPAAYAVPTAQAIPDLNAFLREQTDVLAKATDQAAANGQMQAWLRLMTHRPQYSPRNMLLVLFQDPDATHVGSLHYWATLGRQPAPDATQLWVLAPIGRGRSGPANTEEMDEGAVSGDDAVASDSHQEVHAAEPSRKPQRFIDARPRFIEVPIYDVRCTVGTALPEVPEWRSLSRRVDLDEHLRAFAQVKGIEVKVETLRKHAQGVSMGGLILLVPHAGTKTLAHELMHELLPHHASWIPAPVREWQAEIGAYLICERFGVTGLNCPTYLAGWTASGKQVRKQFEIAADPARDVIAFVESRMGLHAVSGVLGMDTLNEADDAA